jgi:MurNAc alpha-1-phosphate uridylyltransferase
METGGGVKQARRLLGEQPFFVCNIDAVWEEPAGSAMARLAADFDSRRMDARLMLADISQCLGFDGPGDFSMDASGALAHRGERPRADWIYAGVQIVAPRVLDPEPAEPFSFTRIWKRLQREGRLFGSPLGGFWMHIGDPQARAAAEARLAGRT